MAGADGRHGTCHLSIFLKASCSSALVANDRRKLPKTCGHSVAESMSSRWKQMDRLNSYWPAMNFAYYLPAAKPNRSVAWILMCGFKPSRRSLRWWQISICLDLMPDPSAHLMRVKCIDIKCDPCPRLSRLLQGVSDVFRALLERSRESCTELSSILEHPVAIYARSICPVNGR